MYISEQNISKMKNGNVSAKFQIYDTNKYYFELKNDFANLLD